MPDPAAAALAIPQGPGPTRPENRLDLAFAQGRPALVCYLPLGDPLLPHGAAQLYAECGVDVLEIGVPSLNPYLDGRVIAASMRRALEAGMNRDAAAAAIAGLRRDLPSQALVWMTYPDVVDASFAAGVAASGVDGLLVPVPAPKLASLARQVEASGVYPLHFVSHDPSVEEIEAARRARGYVMLQAAPGKTSARSVLLPENGQIIRRLRQAGVSAPLALGFGISTPAQARAAVRLGADGVIVGSATVEAALRGPATLRSFLVSLREGLDAA
ncbi:MAG: tryptophan synthase subunit alpha [Chloroflexota bacterium]